MRGRREEGGVRRKGWGEERGEESSEGEERGVRGRREGIEK